MARTCPGRRNALRSPEVAIERDTEIRLCPAQSRLIGVVQRSRHHLSLFDPVVPKTRGQPAPPSSSLL